MSRREFGRRATQAAAIAVLAWWVPLAGLAQSSPDEGPTPNPEASKEVLSPTFTPPEVAQASDRLKQELRRVIERIAPEAAVTLIAEQLPSLEKEIVTRIESSRDTLSTPSSLAQLAELERGFQATSSGLAVWRATLARRSAGIEQLLAEVKGREDRWARTRAEIRADAPPELLAAIDVNLAAIDEASQGISKRRRELLTLLSGVSRLELTLQDAIEEIVAARKSVRASLFQPDHRDLLDAVRGEHSLSTAPARILDVVRRDAATLRDFVEPRLRSLLWVLVAFVLALVSARAVRDRIRSRRDASEPVTGPVAVFERPLSIALFAAFLAGGVIFPYAPTPAARFAELLVLVPTIRLLQPTLAPHFRPLLYSAAGLFLIDRFRDAVGDVALLERIVLFGESGATALLLLVLLRPSRLAKIPAESMPPPWLGGILRIAMVTLFVSAILNLFGFVTLARLLTDGTLSGTYAGFIIFAAYRIATTGLVVSMTNPWLAQLGMVRNGGAEILTWARRILRPASFLAWFWVVLEAFSIRDWFERGLSRALITPLEVGAVSIAFGDLVALVLAILAAVYASRLVRFVLEQDIYTHLPLNRGVGAAISATVHYTFMVVGFLLALGFAGLDLTKFTILAGALGVGIGFGLQNIVNNFLSGLILLYERPIQVGDVVEVSGELSTVARIGIRSSTVRTVRGAELIVPNGNLISQELKNWTLSDGRRRVEIPVGVAYGTDHGLALEVLRGALEGLDRIHTDPPPVVLFRRFGESSIDFEVRFWSNAEDFPAIESEAIGAIYARLADVGIQIPFPQRDVHLRSGPSGSG